MSGFAGSKYFNILCMQKIIENMLPSNPDTLLNLIILRLIQTKICLLKEDLVVSIQQKFFVLIMRKKKLLYSLDFKQTKGT